MSDTDGLAFEQVAKNYYDWLHRFIDRKVDSHDTAEDILQDALLDAYRSLDTFRGEAQLLSWVLGIVRNKIRHHYRQKSSYSSQTAADETPVEELADDRGDPSQRLLRTQQMRYLAEIFEQLSPDISSAL